MAKSMIQIRDDERMWIAMSDSFVSTVQDRNDPNTLVVRGRKAEHLKRLFPDREIVITPKADYVARVLVPRDEFVRVIAKRLQEISYDNFKDSVDDERLHKLYADFWSLHRRYQEENRRPDRSRHLAWDEGDLECL
jgi:Txe/YoeB family toxin of Txe-Axe toxin-antitoxin module